MKSKGITPTVFLYNQLIDAKLSANKFDDANKYLQEMRSYGGIPNFYSYWPFINYFSRNPEKEKFLVIINKVLSISDTIPPDMAIIICKAFSRNGCLDEMIAFYELLKLKNQVNPLVKKSFLQSLEHVGNPELLRKYSNE